MSGDHADNAFVGGDHLGQFFGLGQRDLIDDRTEQMCGRMVQREEYGRVGGCGGEYAAQPAVGFLGESAAGFAGDARIQQGHGQIADPMCVVDRRGRRGFAEQDRAEGGTVVVITGQGVDGDIGVECAARLGILLGLTRIGDIAGHQNGIGPASQIGEIGHDPLDPFGIAGAEIEMGIADLSHQDHRRSLSLGDRSIASEGVGIVCRHVYRLDDLRVPRRHEAGHR